MSQNEVATSGEVCQKKSSRLTKARLEKAKDMFEAGILDEKAYEKIIM